MTRKDYVKFAALFAGEMALARSSASNGDYKHPVVVSGIIKSTADIFAQDNPRFDREKFYAASGI